MGSGPPIFILGITGRSGTNYLRDLIVQHPDCVSASRPVWEDFYVAEAEPLFEFVGAVRKHWRRWDSNDRGAALLPLIGNALIEFLAPETDSRIVSKTPSVRNLDRFFELFPEAFLVIVVRDARSVAASAVRSFDGDYALWARTWSKAARKILQFDQAHQGEALRYRVVRYEDVQADPRSSMRDLLAFLELNAEQYDFEAAEQLPVRGSSDLALTGDMHWQPVMPPPDFEPLKRWKEWPRHRLERFDWIAGPYLEAFGYPRSYDSHVYPRIFHRTLDIRDLALAGSIKVRRNFLRR